MPSPNHSPRAPFFRSLAVAAAAVLVLAGCSAAPSDDGGPADSGSAGSDSATTAPVPAAMPPDEAADTELDELFTSESLATYTGQELQWEQCDDDEDMECAFMTAPIDYQDPSVGEIEVAFARTSSGADHYLFTNPGGPGSSGIDFLSWAAGTTLGPDIQDSYNLISFDPRGVERTSPVQCMSDAQVDAAREEQLVNPQDMDWDAELVLAQQAVDECAEEMGPVIGHLDTNTVTLDMELMRRVLDTPEMNYLGFSYGTALGARYAENFPHRVGAMVLDAAMDPSLEGEQVSAQQMDGFLAATEDWANYCLSQANDCPFSGTVEDVKAEIHDRLTELDANPVNFGGRNINGLGWMDGFIVPLYDHGTWPILVDALDADLNHGDISQMVALADLNHDRNQDGTYGSNTTQAFRAINCANYGGFENHQDMIENYETVTEASPLFGRYFTSTGLSCNVWPNAGQHDPVEVSAAGTPPILVIGMTGDPATPYQWSESLAEQLDSGVLITLQGFGHTSYGGKSGCIDAAVEGFLVDGQVPDDGTVCQ